MKKLIIFGTGELAQIVHYFFKHDSDYCPVAFTVDGAYLEEANYEGLPVVAFEECPAVSPRPSLMPSWPWASAR